MESKIINFRIYRYHLLPIEIKNTQIQLFEELKTYSYEELANLKNSFFAQILNNLPNLIDNSHPLKMESIDGDTYLLKLAQTKTTIITQNFSNTSILNEPYCYVIINNNKEVQKIAISENPAAFSSPDTVKNILKRVFRSDLQKYGLSIELEQLFDSIDFWDFVSKHENKITEIDFTFIKPNLANISKSLPEDFKAFANDVNSHESQIIIKSPEKGTLTNINQKNPTINGLVEYSANGAGSVKVKVKKFRKKMNTKEKPVILEIRELEIEGESEQVIKTWKEIVN